MKTIHSLAVAFAMLALPIVPIAAQGLAPQVLITGTPTTIEATSATFAGYVNPKGSPTTAVFQCGSIPAVFDLEVAAAPHPGGGNVIRAVSGTIAGLTPDTEYHVRLSATNQTGTTYSQVVIFRTKALPLPTVYTYAATAIEASGATLNSIVNFPSGQPGTAKFQYGLTTNYGSEIAATPSGPWTLAVVNGLTPNATYHYRIVATNAFGSVEGADMTFKTSVHQPPSVETLSVGSMIHSTTIVQVQLRGLVSSTPYSPTIKFELGTTTAYGTAVPVPLAPDGSVPRDAKVTVIVQPETTYHYRLVATDTGGSSHGEDITFTTNPLITAPVIGDVVLDEVIYDRVLINATINPGGMQTEIYTQYGLTDGYGMERGAGHLFDYSMQQAFPNLVNLSPSTTYHYRIRATNWVGTTYSADATFTTPAGPVGAPGVWLTYEMRVDPSHCTAGVLVSADRKSAQCTAAGDVVGLLLYAVIHNGNGTSTDDGFSTGSGSFVATSSGGLIGDLRGDLGGRTLQNNTPGFDDFEYAQSGNAADLDGDGGLDVGDIINHGEGGPNLPWFGAVALNDVVWGNSSTTEPAEFLIGRTTYTLKSAQSGQSSTINFVPRLAIESPRIPIQKCNKFYLDGAYVPLRSNSDKIEIAAPVTLTFIVTDQDHDGLLDSWEVAHFGTTAGHDALGDEDGDGIINLLEEAFDTDPLVASPVAGPEVVNEGGYLTMTIAKQRGVLYEVQSADSPDASAFSPVNTTIFINDDTMLKVRDDFPVATSPTRFLRVKVTAAP